MQAQHIMKRDVITVKNTDTVKTVVEKFIQYGISGLPVIDDNNHIIGYISDGDIMRFIGKHKDIMINTFDYMAVIKDQDEYEERAQKLLELNVMEVAKTSVLKIAYSEKVENIAAILGKKHIKKLPVERDGKLVGIISRGDVIRESFRSLL
ncbi:CBS domain-containing protein [Bacillus sp. HNG]|uniref:CBS domain-containing protein n=1 Tax=Bacillus sp. HNG TaxID=2293325 RepID=UPI000E2E9369|nr:CBS domain-containing protein [Bacillus sp. HNG]RFB18919.1 CBS domain-containing protein [Bacillus sp. HNG]